MFWPFKKKKIEKDKYKIKHFKTKEDIAKHVQPKIEYIYQTIARNGWDPVNILWWYSDKFIKANPDLYKEKFKQMACHEVLKKMEKPKNKEDIQ